MKYFEQILTQVINDEMEVMKIRIRKRKDENDGKKGKKW